MPRGGESEGGREVGRYEKGRRPSLGGTYGVKFVHGGGGGGGHRQP